jgi:ubiquinone/menaquinone biosynthesis C-methylase UbiE
MGASSGRCPSYAAGGTGVTRPARARPRYAPVADALVEASALRATDDVLELGAGTGLVTGRAARLVRSLLATEASRDTLALARDAHRRQRNVSFALVDYSLPLPFLDDSFSVVLSGLT